MCLKYLLIAVLIGLCHGDVSEISEQKIDLPFNDLLPPLLDELTTSSTTSSSSTSSTTSTTTTVAPPTAAITKPTKKSYYQKPAQLNKEDKSKQPPTSSGKQAIQLLSLDLLPPFEDEVRPEESKPEEVAKVEPKPVAKLAAAPRPQHVAKVAPPQPVLRPQYARIAAPAIHATQSPHVGVAGYTSRFSNYFLTSTPRPRRGPLPTLTPFPRHLK